jgi:micrococcal nuclease
MIARNNHVFLGLWSMLLIGCSAPPGRTVLPGRATPPDREVMPRARVAYVIDGDTIIVTTRAGRSRVRLLGVNAPESTPHPGCYGGRAAAELRRLLPRGTRVLLVRDRRRMDPYGRHLGYVWRADGMFVNRALVRGGFATTLFLPPTTEPNGGPDPELDTGIRAELESAQDAAQRERAGLWRACVAEHGPALIASIHPKPAMRTD